MIAIGSSHRKPDPGVPALTVTPAEAEPRRTLSTTTVFFVAESRRIDQKHLGDRVGALVPGKAAELEKLRGLGL